jgi:tetratricopeptide (TPR) repeat protein
VRIRRPEGKTIVAALLLASTTVSCAYYNTFYLARRYYDRATPAAPYVIDKPDAAAVTNFNKSIDYSKKLIADYPKSKWVDDAYLLWARSLLGRDDPIGTVNMLRDFPTRYPESPLKDKALFYLGVGNRKARQYTDALAALDEFIKKYPKNELMSYALLERSTVLMALDRPGEAAAAASEVLEHYPKSKEHERAMTLRADALLAQGDFERARADYRTLGTEARSDDERFGFLLKEADCLEAGRRYDEELALLRDAQSHEQEPQVTAGVPTGGDPASVDRWGRITLRIGTAEMLAGRKDASLEAYRRVVDGLPRTLIAAEAQYRMGYAYEILTDDFETARGEYAKVQTIAPGSSFITQANQRQTNLQRLIQYRAGAGPDSAGKKAEAGLMLAELYLFQLDKPERALEEYRKVSQTAVGTAYGGKARNAEAWVLRNKLHRDAEADSVLWTVVREYPKTEAQVDARDYLERVGIEVPGNLIQLPEEPLLASADTTRLTAPPTQTDSLGMHRTPVPGMAPVAATEPKLQFVTSGQASMVQPPSFTGPGTHAPAPTGAAIAGAAVAGTAAGSAPARSAVAPAAGAAPAFHDPTSWPDPPDAVPVGHATPAPRDTVQGH